MTDTKPQIRTREEIIELKKSWYFDPLRDLYESEGFEAHREELKEYQEEIEKTEHDRILRICLKSCQLTKTEHEKNTKREIYIR